MKNLQKLGGLSALFEGISFIIGIALLVTVISTANYGSLDIDPIQNVVFLVENQTVLYAWNFIIYVAFGVFLVVLSVALYERLKAETPALAAVGAAFGLIWSGLVIASGMVANIGAGIVIDLYAINPEQAASTWLSLTFVTDGLGGGNEIVGGIWVALVSWAALQSRKLPKYLNYLGLVIGTAGILTTIPILGELGAVFGIGLIVWFFWAGIAMLRDG